MRVADLALGAIVGWSAIGLVGISVSARRGERFKARRGLAWIAAVWIAYLAVLLGVSRTAPQRRLPPGQEQCFGTVCYAVTAAEELPGYSGRGPSGPAPRERLVRVSVRVLNRARSGLAEQPAIRAYLIDGAGRLAYPVPGLSGVHLTAPRLAGQPVLSQPVFRVPDGATALSLVLTKGPWQPGLLVIGDPDSWKHRPVLMSLPR